MSQSNHPEQAGSINTTISGIGNAYGDYTQTNVTINQTQLPPLPINLRALVQPLIDNYLKEPFGGRDAELAMLDAFLADPDCAYGLLVAPTGLGKTALLIHWLSHLQKQRPNYQIIFALSVFAIKQRPNRPSTASWPIALPKSITILKVFANTIKPKACAPLSSTIYADHCPLAPKC